MIAGQHSMPDNMIDMEIDGDLFTIQHFTAAGSANRINLRPYPQDHYKVFFLCNSKGVYQLDENAYPFDWNSVCFVSPGTSARIKTQENATGYLLSFSSGFLSHYEDDQLSGDFSRLIFLFSQYQCMHLQVDMAQEIAETFAKMSKEFCNSYALKLELLRRYLKILLILLERQAGLDGLPENPFANMQLAGKFISLLEKNYRTVKMVSGYAELLNVSPNHLNEFVKKATGHPVSYHIQQRIILEAKRKAAYSDTNMKQIAFNLGFDDIAHFSRYFKTFSGTSFKVFKKSAYA